MYRTANKLNFYTILLQIVTYSYLVLFLVLLIGCNEPNKGYYMLANGESESCVACHEKTTGFSQYHDPTKIGCSACHLGNIKETDKDKSHAGMIKIPGNLNNAAQTCSSAECHQSELHRIKSSLMSTNSGIVSIDKWAFDEIHTTDTLFHIENIGNTAAETHLKNLCFKCHLGYEKKDYAATDENSRGGGCLACHLTYLNDSKPDINDDIHPNLSLNISNDKCFGCHSRSNRISTNYEGWYETLYTENEVKDSVGYRVLQDGRVFGYAGEDVHHKARLLCIDCHSSQEVMGDGIAYKHQSEALKIQCKDCHTPTSFKTAGFEAFGEAEIIDYTLRQYKSASTKFIITEKDSIPLVNTYFDENEQAYLISKIDQSKHLIKRSCEQDNVHQSLDCNMCHTSWAPSCIGCHTSYNNQIQLTNGKKGKWTEMLGGFGYGKPVMGVSTEGGKKQIMPAVPGMIMTLDKTAFTGTKVGRDLIFLRLFAPVGAHTTVKESRSCESCHTSSEALGYGQGSLTYRVSNSRGSWQFEPAYENTEQDSLPQDAWNGFLYKIDDSRKYSAHENFLPLNLEEQKRVLQVGACLYCHKDEISIREEMTKGNYQNLLRKMSKECVLPF